MITKAIDAAFLATAVAVGDAWVLACLEASTGETLVSEPFDASRLAAEISGLPIKHFLRVGHALPEDSRAALGSTLCEDLPANYLSSVQALELLRANYGLEEFLRFVIGTPVSTLWGFWSLMFRARSSRSA